MFNNIKLSCIAKKTVSYVTINRKTKQLCDLLMKKNILLGYRIVSLNSYDIFEVHLNNDVKHYDLRSFIKSNNVRIVSLQNAISLNNRYTHSCYIFMTSKGMLTLPEMIKSKIGGKLMFKLK